MVRTPCYLYKHSTSFSRKMSKLQIVFEGKQPENSIKILWTSLNSIEISVGIKILSFSFKIYLKFSNCACLTQSCSPPHVDPVRRPVQAKPKVLLHCSYFIYSYIYSFQSLFHIFLHDISKEEGKIAQCSAILDFEEDWGRTFSSAVNLLQAHIKDYQQNFKCNLLVVHNSFSFIPFFVKKAMRSREMIIYKLL